MKFMIIDGYSKSSRAKLNEAGMTYAWKLYGDMLKKYLPHAEYEVFSPTNTEVDDFPDEKKLSTFNGIIWTGADLDINETHIPTIAAQIKLAELAYEIGIDSWGSCWGIQMAAVAAGGSVEKNPKGREMGIGRKITKTAEGLNHPMLKGKSIVFDAFESHYDIVVNVPEGGVVLARNPFSDIQAMIVKHKKGTFWASQYHPEYDLHEIARLTLAREELLIDHGFFKEHDDVQAYVDKMEELYNEPDRKDLSWQLGVDEDIIDDRIRQSEIKNWLNYIKDK
ncbi:MAG: type 1 glutamine amidotransferase [Spirochaetaceae bacterium]|jgi:GMP synthase (glutamine-hydrolysing)|nr:type 1 glutamine amidotransferase [Spirochaetaceae bacterium]